MAKTVITTRRAEELFAALSLPPRDLTGDRLLLIGPRTVQEFYLAWLYGFSWDKIEGIDLYKTHPKIHVMNMEAMTFAEASFDSILMSATLAYAKDVRTCLSECARVLRPGGYLVFGQTFCPGSEYHGNKISGDETRRILLQLNLEPFYYRQAEKINSLGMQQTSHLFGVRKPDGVPIFDPVRWGM
jgi:SAM-dependent methyltransferase